MTTGIERLAAAIADVLTSSGLAAANTAATEAVNNLPGPCVGPYLADALVALASQQAAATQPRPILAGMRPRATVIPLTDGGEARAAAVCAAIEAAMLDGRTADAEQIAAEAAATADWHRDNASRSATVAGTRLVADRAAACLASLREPRPVTIDGVS